MYDNPGKCISLRSTVAMTDKYLAVKMSGSEIVLATSAANVIVGFVQREGIATEVLPVMVNGISMAKAGDAIAAGSPICPTTGGKVITAAGRYCGIALEAASAANDIIPVLVIPGGFANMLSSIAVTTPPTKTTYTAGEDFDPAAMGVTATFTDGTIFTTAVIDNANLVFTPSTDLAVSDTAIAIAYTYNNVTKTTSQAITVSAPIALSSIAVTTPPTKTTYTAGENFDPTDLVVTATFTDNTTAVIANANLVFTPSENLAVTDEAITIAYTYNNVTKTATQAITVSGVE